MCEPAVRCALDDLPAPDRLAIRALRTDFAALLNQLSAAVDEALLGALARATWVWDQVDSQPLLPAPWRTRLAAFRLRLTNDAAHATPQVRAVVLETQVALAAVLGLLRVLDRRLPSLIRLRTRAQDPTLIAGGRPFLDVPAAIAEVARGWV